jgi:hypothetical protein
MARDSLVEIHDSVTNVIKEKLPWWHDPVLVTGGVTIGAIIGIVLTLILH